MQRTDLIMQRWGAYREYLLSTYYVPDTILSIRYNGVPDGQYILRGAFSLLGEIDYLNSYDRGAYGKNIGSSLEVDSL